MTARMIRIDDEYTQKFEDFVKASDGHIQVVDDPNLEQDEFFYKRREELHQYREDISSGKIEMIEEDIFENDMDSFEKELTLKYENQ